MEWWDSLVELLLSPYGVNVGRAAILVTGGFVLAKWLSVSAVFLTRRYTQKQGAMLVRRGSFWVVMGLALASALAELGFDITIILGAAGILTVALGFASQTSASNLISGLFLIGERPFVVGDVIKVGSTTGEVLTIDLLSVKLRTFDNLFVRVPNEVLIKSEITNLTRFPIRRLDLKIGVAYKENIAHVREVLMDVADRNPLCLVEPAPLFIFTGFGDSALELQFSVWSKRENFLALRNSIQEEIKTAFEEQGILIPFPHRTLEIKLPEEGLPVYMAESHTPQAHKRTGTE